MSEGHHIVDATAIISAVGIAGAFSETAAARNAPNIAVICAVVLANI